MGKDLAKEFLPSKALFEEADQLLGFALSTLCWEGPQELLTRTENCQPALYVTSLAAFAAFQSAICNLKSEMTGVAAAGLSLGEYTALVAAGALSFQDGLRLVRFRGQAMEEASRKSPGRMASVLGLGLEVLEAVCQETGAQVANVNCPGQLVISGLPESIQAASERAMEKGAKRVVTLEVGGAFHSRLMEPAGAELKKALESVEVSEPRIPVISNVTGSAYTRSSQIRTLLVEQLTRPVLWEACMRTLLSDGIRTFLEVGPGTVLKGLLRRIDPEATVLSVGTADQVRTLRHGA